jgi:hypothetical protein
MNDFTIDEQSRKVIRKTHAELIIQSMLFDMDIDWETASLMPKSDYKEAVWLTRWKEKQSNADWTVIDNGF